MKNGNRFLRKRFCTQQVCACMCVHTHTQRGVLVVNILTTNSLICIYHRKQI